MRSQRPKVAIVGCGNVGSTFAFSLSISGAAREMVLIDRNQERAKGFKTVKNYIDKYIQV